MAATAPKAQGSALPQKLLDEAVRLKVEIAGRSEDQVRQAVREAWIEENRAAIESWNAWTEKNGLPLERYRAF
ncbi:MAG TPA: type II toxin-antitoxin system CcdA family antitoxin [Allosphingosinicella sp.]|nr:type II toxin-antitoxin system CcdA family antitoxin [Allosphingosinicella sp.]